MKRRGLLIACTGLVALAGASYWQRNNLLRAALTNRSNDVVATNAATIGSDTCVLTPEQIEGPYFFDAPVRSSIGEDRDGLPLTLNLEVIGPDCVPLQNAAVEVWHCDASGAYSGYGGELSRKPFETMTSIGPSGHVKPIESTTYLRGGQFTDASGLAQFQTIYPGWYEPRVTHIHAKISVGEKSFLTTQLYFPDALSAEIYETHPDYVTFGGSPYNLRNDIVLSDLNNNTGLVLNIDQQADRVIASARLVAA